jgi:hypothetical protein
MTTSDERIAEQEHGADRSQRFRSVQRRGPVAAGSGGSCSSLAPCTSFQFHVMVMSVYRALLCRT